MDCIRRISELTAPAAEPISLEELKAHLRITNSSEDLWLTAVIKAARLACEDYSSCAFIQRTFRQMMDQPNGPRNEWWNGTRETAVSILSSGHFEILKRPLVGVQSIKMFDDSDVETLIDAGSYYVDTSDQLQPGRVVLRRGEVWPVALRVINGMQCDFTAGFSATAADLPADLVMAIKMVAGHMYVNRGDCSCDQGGAKGALAPSGAAMLLDSFRLVTF